MIDEAPVPEPTPSSHIAMGAAVPRLVLVARPPIVVAEAGHRQEGTFGRA